MIPSISTLYIPLNNQIVCHTWLQGMSTVILENKFPFFANTFQFHRHAGAAKLIPRCMVFIVYASTNTINKWKSATKPNKRESRNTIECSVGYSERKTQRILYVVWYNIPSMNQSVNSNPFFFHFESPCWILYFPWLWVVVAKEPSSAGETHTNKYTIVGELNDKSKCHYCYSTESHVVYSLVYQRTIMWYQIYNYVRHFIIIQPAYIPSLAFFSTTPCMYAYMCRCTHIKTAVGLYSMQNSNQYTNRNVILWIVFTST